MHCRSIDFEGENTEGKEPKQPPGLEALKDGGAEAEETLELAFLFIF